MREERWYGLNYLDGFAITIACAFAIGISTIAILETFGLLDDFIAIVEGIKTGWAAYMKPWKAHGFNAFFGWYFVFLTLIFLFVTALWLVAFPFLWFFDIDFPYYYIYFPTIFFIVIPLITWICIGLGYYYWYLPGPSM